MGLLEMSRHTFGGGEEGLQFFVNDGFQIDNGDFVAALLADIFWATRFRRTFVAARANRQSGKKLYRASCRAAWSSCAALQESGCTDPTGFRKRWVRSARRPIRFPAFLPTVQRPVWRVRLR